MIVMALYFGRSTRLFGVIFGLYKRVSQALAHISCLIPGITYSSIPMMEASFSTETYMNFERTVRRYYVGSLHSPPPPPSSTIVMIVQYVDVLKLEAGISYAPEKWLVTEQRIKISWLNIKAQEAS
jgi:hypothetical protein